MVRKLAMPVFIMAGILFVLPWYTARYGGTRIAEIDGIKALTGYQVTIPGFEGSAFLNPDVIIISVAGIILLGILVFFLKGKLSAVFSALLGFFGACLLLLYMFNTDSFYAQLSQSAGNIIHVSWQPGFWSVAGALLFAAVIAAIDLMLPDKKAAQKKYMPPDAVYSEHDVSQIPPALMYQQPPVTPAETPEDDALPVPEEPPVRFCHKCGVQSKPGMGFCHNCGVKLLDIK